MESFPNLICPPHIVLKISGYPPAGDKGLLGTKYIDGSAAEPKTNPEEGFDCWGWVWYYLSVLCDLKIPLNAWEAEKEFEVIKDCPLQWRDVITYKEKEKVIPHCGVMESEYTVLHCSRTSGGVARADIMLPPWRDNIISMRHKSLL